jgi:hypothetical protein
MGREVIEKGSKTIIRRSWRWRWRWSKIGSRRIK